MYRKHQNECHGDMSFMEKFVPEHIKIFHMDSFNTDEGKRFQGSFYSEFCDAIYPVNEAPLELLKAATRYQFNICDCRDEPHITWTIWFD
jgi:hypothetical protein